jgi:hypothetical protein
MHTEALLATSRLRRACMLGIVLSVAIFTTNAEALPEPKVAITYSLKTADCPVIDEYCGYWQMIDAPIDAGDVEFVFDTSASMEPVVDVTRATPLTVTIEYTTNMDGDIIDGPVYLTQTDFGRDFTITTTFLGLDAVVTTLIDTQLWQIGTGTLSGSASPPATITWDNVVAPYEETVLAGSVSDCVGGLCDLAAPTGGWPQDLSTVDEFDNQVGRAVVLPDFTVFTNTLFADEFVSDNGTPGMHSDDIDRPDDQATVTDTWYGVEVVPEPSGEILLFAGVLGLVGLRRLRERGGVSALFVNRR